VSRPYEPDIEGLGLAEHYADMPVDPQDFLNQRVLIIGKGNSAFETADALMETTTVIHVAGPSAVRMAWRTHYVGHLRAVNNNFLDTYQLKSQNAILDGTVREIEKIDGRYRVRFAFVRANEVVKELWYDRIICATGFRLDTSIFAPDCMPELMYHDRFAALSPAFESVNVPGLYVAGTLSQQRDFKHSTNGFIHGFRYQARALARILGARHHRAPWPSRDVEAAPGPLTEALLDRANRTSALWQQFGVLGDVVLLESGRYLEEVPVAFAPEIAGDAPYAILTLEYGPDHDKVDPFDVTVSRIAQDSPGQAHDAAYLHPVLRIHRAGTVLATHHVAENLENEWDRPSHREALHGFLTATLPVVPAGA